MVEIGVFFFSKKKATSELWRAGGGWKMCKRDNRGPGPTGGGTAVLGGRVRPPYQRRSFNTTVSFTVALNPPSFARYRPGR